MKAVLLALALLVGLAGSAAAQSPPVDPALRKAAEARANARYTGNADDYGKYVLDDAIITNSQGDVSTKAQRMKAIRGGGVQAPRPRISDEKYRVVGDVAVHTWREDGQDPDGKKAAARWLEVWVKQQNNWKLSHLQFTDIAKP
jgi:hypothetical protein